MGGVVPRFYRTMAGKYPQAVLFLLALMGSSAPLEQTFELNQPAPSSPAKQKPKSSKNAAPKTETTQNAEPEIGW